MGLFSPRWSPDGRYIAAITFADLKLVLFDFANQKWTEAFGSEIGSMSSGRRVPPVSSEIRHRARDNP
jgi:hypothetical protein